MGHLLLLAALGAGWTLADWPTVRDTAVEGVEFSRVYDERGCLTFLQICGVVWQESEAGHRYDFWRIPRDGCMWLAPGVIILGDGELRRIRYRSAVWSWEMFDPELRQRAVWPESKRKGLSP